MTGTEQVTRTRRMHAARMRIVPGVAARMAGVEHEGCGRRDGPGLWCVVPRSSQRGRMRGRGRGGAVTGPLSTWWSLRGAAPHVAHQHSLGQVPKPDRQARTRHGTTRYTLQQRGSQQEGVQRREVSRASNRVADRVELHPLAQVVVNLDVRLLALDLSIVCPALLGPGHEFLVDGEHNKDRVGEGHEAQSPREAEQADTKRRGRSDAVALQKGRRKVTGGSDECRGDESDLCAGCTGRGRRGCEERVQTRRAVGGGRRLHRGAAVRRAPCLCWLHLSLTRYSQQPHGRKTQISRSTCRR